MVKINIGERVGKDGRIAVGCSASVFDSDYQNILLIRRADNDQWAVPGGYMEPGESLTEACKREVFEETGLIIDVKRLVGIYTSPNMTAEYPDGNILQLVVLHFEAIAVGGTLKVSDESTDAGYFTQDDVEDLSMSQLEKRRALDGFSQYVDAIICDDFVSFSEKD